jgi:hypothetical protein
LFIKMLLHKGFRYSEEFQKILSTSQKIFGSLSAVQTIEPSLPDVHLTTVPSIRTTCHTVRPPVRPSITVRMTCISVRTLHCVEKFISSLHPSGQLSSMSGPLSVLDKLQILSMFKYGKTDSTVRTIWYPIRTRVSLRQESQFKCHSPNVNQPWSGWAFNS